MFSGLIPGLNSANSPDEGLSSPMPSTLIALLDQLLSLGTEFSLFTYGIFWRELLGFGAVLTIALIAWLNYSEAVEEQGGNPAAPPNGELPEPHSAAGSTYPLNDDAKYVVVLQVLEVLWASLFSSRRAGTSAIRKSPTKNGKPSRSFCGICFEDKETRRMFINDGCSHSFCCNCTSKHIIAKIQDNVKVILCPGVDCKSPLDFHACRRIIPNDALVRWDESLCKSLIPESQTMYCPFNDCLALLVNDSGEIIEEIKCPSCRRSICALCRVPWHSEFTCAEFQRLDVNTRGKDDVLVEELAKKKNWRKCPNCKIFVEKTEGCLHITCRCKYQFCYRCGSKWSKVHDGCQRRPP